MKLLHTSDWHLGMSLSVHSLIEDQRYIFNEIQTIIKEHQVDGVLVSGDIYDSSVANSQAINLFNDIVTKICKNMNVPMFIIAGNHDGAARLAACNELLASSGLYIEGKLKDQIAPIELGDTDLYMVPYFNVDEVRALYPEEEIKSYEEAMNCVMNQIRDRMDNQKKNIVMAHAFVVGAHLSDSDRSAQVGTATAVSKDVFAGFDYVALGHIHRPQMVDEHICYSGSPLVYSFGKEESVAKHVVIIDTKTMQTQTVELSPLRLMRSLEGTYDEVMNEDDSEDYLSCKINDRFIGIETVMQLKIKFPNMIEISGKEYTQNNVKSTMSLEDIQDLTKDEIVKSFFEDIYDTVPTKEQLELVSEAEDIVSFQ